MSAQPIAAYSFIPWARHGLGAQVREADLDAGVKARGSIGVSLRVAGERVGGEAFAEDLPARSVSLYGPGDVIGVDAAAIVRTEPHPAITNFEPNYMPFVEFYDEDFPWRYTPARPSDDGRRLRPWLALVVLEQGEIEREGAAGGGRPLPFVEIANAAQKLPPAEQLWAWAHVHVAGGFGGDHSDRAAVAAQLEATVRQDRDRAWSRLLCPRILRPDAAYDALLLPAFETGRLAGLGRDPDQAPYATQSAWGDYPTRAGEEGTLFPYYHRWRFRTGTVGDFEYLVRLLQPRRVDPRVGRRDIDVQAPGSNLPAIPTLGGILRLGGALRAPLETLGTEDRADHDRHDAWGNPYPHPFQRALTALVNLADDYRTQPAPAANAATGVEGVAIDEDPLIVPPLYGRWHAATHRLVAADADPARERWVHELNLDPRHRVAAGLGTQVVQQHQEDYVEAAWRQVGQVLEANERIRLAQLAKLTGAIWHRRELTALQRRSDARLLTLVAPVQRRVLAAGTTIHHQLRHGALPAAAVSKPFRQAVRPRSRADRLTLAASEVPREALLERMNLEDGDPQKVSAAPPKVVAPALATGDELARRLAPPGLPYRWLRWLDSYRWLLVGAALVLIALLFLLVPLLGAAALAAGVAVGVWLGRQLRRARAAAVIDPETRTPESVADMPPSPGFRLDGGAGPSPGTAPGVDSGDARRFKEALRNAYSLDEAERALERPPRRPLDLAAVAAASLHALDPAVSVAARVKDAVQVPPRLDGGARVGDIEEVMAYPEIDQPMYEPLKQLSSEAFLPNIQLIANNSITLLETNQKFIEAYMVGLNHEFARELLWREYPTDQRGSCFRQFWDVKGFLAGSEGAAALRERLRDIPELHEWPLESGLGAHDHREAQGDKEDEVVLVVRGELLKKYPTAVIYAHRAAWERTRGGAIDRSRPRRLADVPEAPAEPSRELVKSPLYEAKVDPDVYFFGFDLTAAAARGGATVDGEEDPGWFFVIKERPGEPRFGLDVPQEAPGPRTISTWNDLAWTDAVTAYAPGGHLRVGDRTVTLVDPGSTSPLKIQHDEDRQFAWRAETHAGEMAYILYQVPVLIAVHGTEMLSERVGQ